MISYKTTTPGDRLRIVGAGAPGFAKRGEIVTVTECNNSDNLYAENSAGEKALFKDQCGAEQLTHAEETP